jgi:hypothetical protein
MSVFVLRFQVEDVANLGFGDINVQGKFNTQYEQLKPAVLSSLHSDAKQQ